MPQLQSAAVDMVDIRTGREADHRLLSGKRHGGRHRASAESDQQGVAERTRQGCQIAPDQAWRIAEASSMRGRRLTEGGSADHTASPMAMPSLHPCLRNVSPGSSCNRPMSRLRRRSPATSAPHNWEPVEIASDGNRHSGPEGCILISGEEARMSFNISLGIIAACFAVSFSGVVLALIARFPHDSSPIVPGGALAASIIGYFTANALRNS